MRQVHAVLVKATTHAAVLGDDVEGNHLLGGAGDGGPHGLVVVVLGGLHPQAHNNEPDARGDLAAPHHVCSREGENEDERGGRTINEACFIIMSVSSPIMSVVDRKRTQMKEGRTSLENLFYD